MADKKQTPLTDTQKVGLGIGLTAAAVAAAGTYFLYGKNNAKNRQAVKGWALKAKGEVLETLEGAKKMSREEYQELINTVAGAYTGIKSASKKDIATFKTEMMDHWQRLEKLVGPKKSAAKKAAVKKAVRTPVKAKKAAPKKAAKKAASKPAPKAEGGSDANS